MALPTYEEAMLPVLKLLSDRKERPRKEIVDAIAEKLELSPEDRAKLLPSGKAPVIVSRVGWALTYMKQARMVETVKRGVYRITDRGIADLKTNPSEINCRYLSKYQEFLEFTLRSSVTSEEGENSAAGSNQPKEQSVASPEEALEDSYATLRAGLEGDLLDAVKSGTPSFFEELVIDLLFKMGYGGSRREAARAVGKSGDGGIDGVIDEDRLGLDVIYVQAKRWENVVGRPEIQKFAGALQGQRARKGIFITTSSFTKDAVEYAQRIDTRIILIDGPKLSQLMFDFDVGVTSKANYVVKQIDGDYFEAE